jgi:hypothetical protein
MSFEAAVKNYTNNQTKENLNKQVNALVGEMTEKEKIYMLSGRCMLVTIKNSMLPLGGYRIELTLYMSGTAAWMR